MMSQPKLKESLARLESVAVSGLSIEQIKLLVRSTDSEMSELADAIQTDYALVSHAVSQGDPYAIATAKRLLSKHQVRAEYLVDLKETLDNRYQQRFMETRMAQRVGGPKVLKLIERLILMLIVFVLALLVYDLTAGPDSMRPASLSTHNIFLVDVCCCAIFMSEFLFRLSSADSKRYVWQHHWIDFVTSIPIPGEAQLARFGRFARLARFARLLRLLRFARLFFFLWRGLDKLQDVVDVKVMKKTIRWTVFATFAGALLIYKVEGAVGLNTEDASQPNAVGTLGQSIWWSFTTVLTGGFGDIHNPTSVTGQVLTGMLVVIGMVLVGVFTATLTSIFVGERSDSSDANMDQILVKLEELAVAKESP